MKVTPDNHAHSARCWDRHKTSQLSRCSLHTQINWMGLLFFLERKSGPLFYRSITGTGRAKAGRITIETPSLNG